MRVCIVGGGKVGYYLAKTLLEHGHTPVLIEDDPAMCRKVADSLDLTVVCGDGTFAEVQESADVAHCSAMVAVTGRDEDNLIVCQLAKQVFKVKRTVARVNNPKNAAVLKKLGVDIAVSATGLAGPDGGTPERPVGTVFLGVATAEGVYDIPLHLTGNRARIRTLTMKTALNALRLEAEKGTQADC